MAAGDTEYAALLQQMDDNTPNCEDDPRFIQDELTPRDVFEMRGMCRTCPLIAACEAYSAAGKPKGGFWAGRHYGATRKDKR
ncbi:WhiB family transcriptional regulator [Microbacterium lacus]|uniref:4Fe-4S Wbl-type domain-containing protein n=1 Tax=Microbacterium lacus TaxID=415217 RepID=A0ABN2GVG8_9MICO